MQETSGHLFWFESFYEEPAVFLKIREMGLLPQGWNFGVGQPPSKNVIAAAIKLADIAIKNNLNLDAFPGKNGQVTVSIYIDGANHSFQVQKDLSVVYWDESDSEGDEEELDFGQAIKKITHIAWNSSSIYIYGFGTERMDTSEAKPSRLQRMEVGSR